MPSAKQKVDQAQEAPVVLRRECVLLVHRTRAAVAYARLAYCHHHRDPGGQLHCILAALKLLRLKRNKSCRSPWWLLQHKRAPLSQLTLHTKFACFLWYVKLKEGEQPKSKISSNSRGEKS